MGNPKQKWTAEEEEALKAGVAKRGTEKWKNIDRDPEFNPFLFSGFNIDLEDKWWNMSVSAGGLGPWEKSQTPKPKASSDASTEPIGDDSARSSTPKYNALIFEALSALKEPNGSDVSAILSYIEE